VRNYRRWTMEQKRQAVERMASCRHEDLAAEIGIPKRHLHILAKPSPGVPSVPKNRFSRPAICDALGHEFSLSSQDSFIETTTTKSHQPAYAWWRNLECGGGHARLFRRRLLQCSPTAHSAN
jgi:hypothetical protein